VLQTRRQGLLLAVVKADSGLHQGGSGIDLCDVVPSNATSMPRSQIVANAYKIADPLRLSRL
jgi:hypothetical protein